MAQSRGRTPLHAAARVGTPVQMSELLAAAGDGAAHAVNAQDNVGMTPLMVAAKALNVEHCLMLLAIDGLDANIADTTGRTALHYVCAARPSSANDLAPYTEVLEALFDRGAEATPDSKGWMPLHVACDAGNYTAVAAILQSAPDGVSVGTPLGWRPLHFAAKSNRAELIPMLLRRGADVSSLCTLDGSPAAPQMTPLEVAKHFKSTLCIEVLEKSAQRGGASSGISASLDDAAKPALANHASGRAIRRTQAGTDVKNTRAPAVAAQPSSTDLGASNNKLSPGYDVVPGQPVNQRPIGPGYQGLPPADAKNRPPAALPPGATPPFGGVAEVQSEYDAVPKELRASLASSTSTAAIGSPRYGDVTALADGGNEYDSVPTELHSIKALKEQSRVQQRKSADLSSEYGKAPPPANGGYLSANVPPPSSTGTLPSFASSSEYAKAPVPLAGFDSRYGAVPGERPPADDDNQYDSIPNELVGTAALKGYTAAPAMSVGVGRSPMRANTGGVPAPVAKPPKPSPPAAQPPQQQPPQQQQQTNSPNDPAASRDFKVALSTARIGRHFKSGWSRTDAENFLRGKPANTFVLRPTTQKGGLITLSFVHPVNGSVQHSLIYDRDGGFTFDEEFGCPPAKSLLALLQWQKLDV